MCRQFFDEPLSLHTSFRIGGPARLFLVPESVEQLLCALKSFPGARLLGKGTNVLAPDEGVDVVISTLGLNKFRFDENLVMSEAGVLLSKLCVESAERGLSGLELLYGIPGTIGGAIFMNAGAYGAQMADVVEWVECFDGERVRVLQRNQLEFSYRDSVFKKRKWLVLRACLRLTKSDPEAVRSKMEEIMKRRLETQPLDVPSAGSFFKRPRDNFYVGKAIEQLGLKGFRIGDAQISTKHAGFIVNLGSATARDVISLAQTVKGLVEKHFNVALEPEVDIW
ncbi:MAG: UDP-N-acetylenolpyruvoylglucosamine reductase [Thermotoga sp. 50_1627]|uniref:UDP-N-acetylmuramate dehydrogenase n=1 Tax=Pseudothermotoga sp. TaxID=2033661 RepID=UPI00076C5FB5|nr:MAG: UDP-N-acetylenolpyruvoylglucosamine reductase [Thermotoga sp. 50_64]KUK24632.1 MAG: UDP-N-acetylenolpyruvoylglucosamine reductase [Thermotoga sp. 50_1627]MBC7117254.1 UDP-N-acetylmuramate dehydrogenase [Pseudothermotoga sp.]HBT39552.1 UDP-N-acetylmuramate dehydrogenase [Pseudothermotoga sp.]HCO98379.1 UDP-N-acetylmuramate dehydrogenase [Pseudothermotoga sp.]